MPATYRTANEEPAEPNTKQRLADRVDDSLAPMHAATDRLKAVHFILDSVVTGTEELAHGIPRLAEMLNMHVNGPLVGALAVLNDAMQEHEEGMERLLKLADNLTFLDVEGS
ncbi:MAG: hypothetical protein RLO50_04425, partial [Azospirillaceae bacterium]